LNYLPGLPWTGTWRLDIQVPCGRVAKQTSGGFWLIINAIDRKADCPSEFAENHLLVYGAIALLSLGETEEEAKEEAKLLTYRDIALAAESHLGPWICWI
jgi:hypothetical protein